ncbi:MAG: hypothetical protein QNJ60_06060 [Xenococcaceae cyanobacterium MO_188.B19]|nr:hypothetical protein [Xenococcaceae cyanobacterium MO_188.B19]
MGINVYPVTKNPDQLEKLAQVPAETINSLREFEKSKPALIDPEANSDDRYEAYCLLNKYQKQIRTLELHGLGKIPFGDLATIIGTEHEPDVFSGLSDEPETIAQILGVLRQRGYSVPDADLLTEGVCWS